MRFAPRFDCVLSNRLGRVGHNQRHVQFDDVAEAVTGGTGTERVVEREETRLRVFVRDAADAALEAFREQVQVLRVVAVRQLQHPGCAATFAVGRLDGVRQALALVVSPKLHSVDHDLQHWLGSQRLHVHIVERKRDAVDEQTTEAATPQCVDGSLDGGRPRC